MKKLYIIAAIMLCAVAAQGAQLFYQFPEASGINDTDRMLIYQNGAGSMNITGAKLKSSLLYPPAQNDLPKQFDIYMLAGTDYALYLRSVDSTGAANNITGYTYAAQYRNAPAPAGTLFATYSATITNASTGRFKITLSKAQTTALSGTAGVWDLLQVDTTGKRTYLLSGKVTAAAPVTP